MPLGYLHFCAFKLLGYFYEEKFPLLTHVLFF